MEETIVCSNCFRDRGLRLFAMDIGLMDHKKCPRCNASNGKKLSKDRVGHLANEFFVRGS